MSIEGQVLGAATVATGAGTAAQLANTGNPVVVGIAVAVAMIVVLGLVTRATQSNR